MRHLLAASGAVAVLAAACVAQGQARMQPQTNDLTNALAIAQTQPTPRAFLFTAIEGDNAEIRLGRLAQTHGGSQAVRSFGRSLEADHIDTRRKADRVARVMGVTPPTTVTAEAQNEYTKLQGLQGRAFDQAFATYVVQNHERDIAEYQAQASGRGPVAKIARDTLPTLQMHLNMAERIETNSGR